MTNFEGGHSLWSNSLSWTNSLGLPGNTSLTAQCKWHVTYILDWICRCIVAT